MNKEQQKKFSKKLSYVLRHNPDAVGIVLDPQGWVEVDLLLGALNQGGNRFSRSKLTEVVAACDKNRFELDETTDRIRARQGHSVEVALGYEPAVPPDVLYHGTARQFVDSILEGGLDKRNRHDVHMSTDIALMRSVGSRRGKPVIVVIDARAMHNAGHAFYVTGNDVWLTDVVPPEFISLEAESTKP